MKFLKKNITEGSSPENECACPMKGIFDSELMRVLAVGALAILATSAIIALACHTIKKISGEEDFTCG